MDEVKQHIEAALQLAETELEKIAPLQELRDRLKEMKDALESTDPNAPQA